MMSRSWLPVAIVAPTLIFLAPLAAAGAGGRYDVRDFGARGDSQTLDTEAIQSAVEAAAEAGGGTVVLADGVFLSGTIRLRSNVSLHLPAGSVLLASLRQHDFPERALIYAQGAENIAVMGDGAIDGHGGVATEFPKVRAHPIYFLQCRNVKVKDVTLRNSTTWLQHYYQCDNLVVDGVTVRSRINPDIEIERHVSGAPGRNEDGLNLNSCSNVRVANCDINSDDDSLVLKSTSARPCTNIAVVNCHLSSNASAIKCGTESGGGFQNVTISNCTVSDTRNSGIALEIVDGGVMDGVNISNIVMDNVKGSAIFLRLGDRGRPYRGENPGVGAMRNIIISNVQATRVGDWIEQPGKRAIGCPISGLPGHPIENVTLENIRLQLIGGGTAEDALREIAEKPEAYPSCRMFGTLPAYGLFIRHAKNIALRNVQLTFQHPDQRPALICEDVAELELAGFDAQSLDSTSLGSVWLRDARGAWIHNCRLKWATPAFLQLNGPNTADVSLVNNDFRQAATLLRLGSEVDQDAVHTANNRLASGGQQ